MAHGWSRNIRDVQFFVNQSKLEKLENFRARTGRASRQTL